MLHRLLLIAVLLLATLGANTPSHAQSIGTLLNAVEGDQDKSPAMSEEFINTLKEAAESGVSVIVMDPQGNVVGQSARLNDLSETDAGEEDTEHTALMNAQAEVDAFREVLAKRLSAMPNSFNEVLYILRASSPSGEIFDFVKILLWSFVFLAVGIVFEREVYAKRVARHWVMSRVRDAPKGYSEKLPFLFFRFFMGALGVLISVVVAYIVGTIFLGTADDTAVRFTVVIINVAYIVSRLIALVWRMILAPYLTQYRIPHLTDREALRLHHWLWIIATLDVFAILAANWIKELGLNYDVYALMSSIFSLVLAILNILMVYYNRATITHAITNGVPRKLQSVLVRWMATLWMPFVLIFIVFSWLELTYDLVLNTPTSVPLIAAAYTVIISVVVFYGVVNYAIERYFEHSRRLAQVRHYREQKEAAEAATALAAQMASHMDDGDGEDYTVITGDAPTTIETFAEHQHDALEKAERHRMESFEDLARRVSGILAFVAGLWAWAMLWGVDQMMTGDTAIDRLFDVIVILFIGYVAFSAFRIWVDTKIEAERGDEVEGELGDEGGETGASRLATLLPLFRNAVLIVIVVTITLILLLQMGINVSPLFAGAGIVGIAVGFGAQSLVRDIFSGAFFLFDDAFRKGEYIDVGGVKGTVESISVRSFQLRHHLGPLHTIPFGEIQFLTNYSRDWVIMKLPLRLTYDTDVEQVRKLIKKLGVELLDDPVIGDNFIQPLKSQGVIRMEDSAMIIRVKFMTKPGDQWLVRKKVFEDIRTLFEREGIHFAHREVTVRLAEEHAGDLSEKQKKTVLAAAQASIDEDELDVNDGGGDDR